MFAVCSEAISQGTLVLWPKGPVCLPRLDCNDCKRHIMTLGRHEEAIRCGPDWRGCCAGCNKSTDNITIHSMERAKNTECAQYNTTLVNGCCGWSIKMAGMGPSFVKTLSRMCIRMTGHGGQVFCWDSSNSDNKMTSNRATVPPQEHSDMQCQAAVTAYFSSEQSLSIVFAWRHCGDQRPSDLAENP